MSDYEYARIFLFSGIFVGTLISLAAATIYLLVFRLVAGMIDRFRDGGTLPKTNG